jgi:glyceraldehyde 3-phosphate dehydrogenase
MKIAINGFGRIGRVTARALFSNSELRKQLELVAINDLASPKDLAFAMKHDSTHGKLPFEISFDAESITIDGLRFACLKIPNPSELPWGKLGVDLVLECSGRYTDKEAASAHLKAGAKKVIVSAPAKGVDLTVVMGVNHMQYDASKHHVLSNASCTTNCLAPVVHTLHSNFGLKHGFMTTIHSYTSDQRLIDNIHSDPRRSRTAGTNMIPTTTGAAKTVGEVIPELKGKLDGFSVRVPTPNVSLTDFVAELNREVTVKEVNDALVKASQEGLKGIMQICHEPLVSSDFNGNPYSSIVDIECTKVIGGSGDKGTMVKVDAWYDNETGFSTRMLELCKLVAQKGV